MEGNNEIREILIPLDGSGTAEWALPAAVAIARQTGARLHLLLVHASLARIFPDVTATGYMDDWEERERDREDQYVRSVAESLKDAGFRTVAETATGDAVSELVDRIARMDLAVMTAHGWAGPERAWLGHVADAVVHHVRRPVIVVRADSNAAPEDPTARQPGFQRVFVATDGSPAAQAAEWHGEQMARLFGAHLTLYRAVRAPAGPSSPYIPHAAALDRDAVAEWEREAREYLDARAAAIEGLELSTRMETTYHAARAILDAVTEEDADLVAVGTHRDSRLARAVLGSVADKVVRGIRTPVLIAHADTS